MKPLRGYGILQPGDRQRFLTDAEIRAVDFVVLRDRWKYLNPADGEFDLARYDSQIGRVESLKRPWILAPMTGCDCTPDWIDGPRLDWKFGGKTYSDYIPPWSSQVVNRYERLMAQLHGRYHNRDIAAVWITGPTVPSQEMHTNGLEKQNGYSTKKMLDAWTACYDIVADRFTDRQLIISVSGQASALAHVKPFIDYVKAQEGGNFDRIAFQHNSLGTQTSVASAHHKLVLSLGKQGATIGAEMVQPGHTAAISKFSQANYIVGYPGDEKKKRPKLAA